MRAKILMAIIYSLVLSSHAQVWQWAIKGGGIYSDKAQAIDIDSDGNAYVAGYYNVGQPADITVNFGPFSPATDWGKEGFIAKVDKSGNFVWVKSAIGGYDDRVLGIHVDKVNNFVYATGTQWKWAPSFNSFTVGSCVDNYTYTYGSHDQIFVSKMDLNGNCQWLIPAGGDGDDHGFDLTTDKSGNIYLTGFVSDNSYSLSPIMFGTFSLTVPPGDSTAFVAKISPSGVYQWVKTFGGQDGERDNRIEVDSAGNVYVTGGFYGTKTFGTTTLTAAGVDIFVVKYDKNGNFIWVRQAGGPLDDRANAIAIDPKQQIFITGEFRDHCAFTLQDTLNNNGGPNGRDIFVAKMNTEGTWIWEKKAGSNAGGERGNGIYANAKGNVFVTGTFADTAKFGGSITLISSPTTTVDVFVAAIDTLGKWRWAIKGGGMLEDKGNGIACDDSCNIYTTGWFEQAASFGSAINLSAYGSKDIFVSRLQGDCFTYTTLATGIDYLNPKEWNGIAFPNPASEFIQIKVSGNNFDPLHISIKFIDMLGRDVKVNQMDETRMIFDVSSLTDGIYIIELSDEFYSKKIKFIKK